MRTMYRATKKELDAVTDTEEATKREATMRSVPMRQTDVYFLRT